MNKLFKLFAITLATAFLFTACGGGSSSDSGPGATPAGTFTKIASNVSSNYAGSFNQSSVYAHWQSLYKASGSTNSAINASGKITGIAIQYHTGLGTNVTCTNLTIKLGHTSLSAVTDTFANNVSNGKGGQTTVLSNGTVTFPADAAGTWHNITFTTPFDYNGVDNLIVEFERTAACSGDVYDGIQGGLVDDSTLWSYTSGNTTGSVEKWVHNAKFTFAGGDNNIICADSDGDNGNSIAPGETGRTQMLILASDINGSGMITGMAIRPSTTTASSDITELSVKIAHLPSSTTTLTSNQFSVNYGGVTPVTVTQNLAYHIPAGSTSAVWIPFNIGSFTYDGTSNLLIDISCTSSASYAVDYEDISTDRTLLAATLNATNGSLMDRGFEPVFRFYGGTMDVIDKYDGDATVFGNSSGGYQFILRAAELGTSGSITRLAFRLSSSSGSVPIAYPDFTVILAHTTQNSLVADDATNVAGGTTVFNNTFNLSANLLGGDWIEIPLSTPFYYNGTDNLVIQTKTSGGTSAKWCQITNGNPRFFACEKATGGSVLNNSRGVFKFWVSK
ncbi:MAG: hypothetical protein V1874_15545 [Spirochaetota bacterium]